MYKLSQNLLLLLVIFSISAFAGDDLEKKILPDKIYALTKAITQSDIEKTLGKVDHKEAGSLYYIFHEYKYALSIKLKDGKIASFVYIFGPSKYNLPNITHEQKFKSLKSYPEAGHEAGRYIFGELEKNNFSYLFKNNSEKSLYSVSWKRVE